MRRFFDADSNGYITANPRALGAPLIVGRAVHAPAWYRDPPSAKSTSLSNALEFTILPEQRVEPLPS